jgi:hypothetical protein
MENRWSARNISLLCAVPTDAFQAEIIIWANTRSYVRVDADQSLDPPYLFNLVGFVRGGAEKVAALTMFGLSGLSRFRIHTPLFDSKLVESKYSSVNAFDSMSQIMEQTLMLDYVRRRKPALTMAGAGVIHLRSDMSQQNSVIKSNWSRLAIADIRHCVCRRDQCQYPLPQIVLSYRL